MYKNDIILLKNFLKFGVKNGGIYVVMNIYKC